MPDIGRESVCPKCGYNPDYPDREEYRHSVMYDREHESILVSCWRCAHTWREPCNDREKPKVVKMK